MAGLLVAAAHGVLLGVLLSGARPARPPAPRLVASLIVERLQRPPPPPPVPPTLPAPRFAPPLPELRVAPPEATPRAITRPQSPAAPRAAAGNAGSGLGLDLGAAATGGTVARAALGDFAAEVRRRILARRRQPVLAWDRRNTCIVEYTVRVGGGGRLAGFSIEPCAVPEINAAARAAIAEAAPFPPPPALGGDAAEVHGTLIFRP